MNALRTLCALSLIASVGCGSSSEAADTPSTEPVATVSVQSLTTRDITRELTVYGVVVPGPRAHYSVSVPFEASVGRVLVRVGQRVDMGEELAVVAPSADARLSLSQARADSVVATAALASAQARLASHLATQMEVSDAQRAVDDAALRVRSLVQRGAARTTTLKAPGPGIVTGIPANEGALVPVGGPVVELDSSDHREVRLGVGVDAVGLVSEGSPLHVQDLALPPRVGVDGVIRSVGQSVDPDTRLVDLYASLPAESGLLLGQRVSAQIPVHSGPVLVVPRTALVPSPESMIVFTVDAQNRAHAHEVRVGLENDTDAEVSAPDLHEGASVVVSGAPVLEEGMRVRQASP